MDTTIPSLRRSSKHPLPGIGLNDPLHGRQACPEFNSFHQGVGQVSPREGLFSCRSVPKRGQICYIPALSQSLNDSAAPCVTSGCSSIFDFTMIATCRYQWYNHNSKNATSTSLVYITLQPNCTTLESYVQTGFLFPEQSQISTIPSYSINSSRAITIALV